MKRRLFRAHLLPPLLLLLLVLVACGSEAAPSLEEQARSINRSLICPVCPGETIDQAQVELARQMRAVVRERLAEGWTRDQVLQFFVDRYGESVLAAPPKEGFNLVAWVVPVVVVVGAFAVLFLVVRAMRRDAPAPAGPESYSEEGLEEYLAIVDLEVDAPQVGIQRESGGLAPGRASEKKDG